VHAHSSLRDDAQEWAAALAALMDASRPTAAAFLAGFVAKARPVSACTTVTAPVLLFSCLPLSCLLLFRLMIPTADLLVCTMKSSGL
jgi:hypothetical protein